MSRYPTGDPLLKGADWQHVRRYWIRQRRPCTRCGCRINYTPGHTGPDALDVGHITSRDEAKALGWTRQQTNSITNTQPECRTCNRTAGATYGAAKRDLNREPPRATESDEW